jgi:butyryl-CoA dehydrogenase
VPEEYGGAGLDYLTLALVLLEEIAAGDGATSTVVSVNNCPVNSILMAFGNDGAEGALPQAAGARRDARRLLPDRAACGLGGRRPATTAVREATTTCSTASSSSSPAARTATWPSSWPSPTRRRQEGHQRLHRAHQHARLQVARLEDKMGQHSQRHGADQLRQLPRAGRAPARRRGHGLKIALSGWRAGASASPRRAWAWRARAFEAALAYSKERRAFGQPIFKHQAVQFKLAEWPRRSRPRAS